MGLGFILHKDEGLGGGVWEGLGMCVTVGTTRAVSSLKHECQVRGGLWRAGKTGRLCRSKGRGGTKVEGLLVLHMGRGWEESAGGSGSSSFLQMVREYNIIYTTLRLPF